MILPPFRRATPAGRNPNKSLKGIETSLLLLQSLPAYGVEILINP